MFMFSTLSLSAWPILARGETRIGNITTAIGTKYCPKKNLLTNLTLRLLRKLPRLATMLTLSLRGEALALGLKLATVLTPTQKRKLLRLATKQTLTQKGKLLKLLLGLAIKVTPT